MIVIVHVLVAIGITGLVLLQQGKGADMGASFGSGASQTIFGSTGSGNVLTKSTSWLAVIFFITSLALALFARQQASQGVQESGLIEDLGQLESVQTTVPGQDVPQVPALDASTDVPETTQQALEAVETEVDAELDAAVEGVAAEAAEAVDVVEEAADAAVSEEPSEQAEEE